MKRKSILQAIKNGEISYANEWSAMNSGHGWKVNVYGAPISFSKLIELQDLGLIKLPGIQRNVKTKPIII